MGRIERTWIVIRGRHNQHVRVADFTFTMPTRGPADVIRIVSIAGTSIMGMSTSAPSPVVSASHITRTLGVGLEWFLAKLILEAKVSDQYKERSPRTPKASR
jgi:hypothetical protein